MIVRNDVLDQVDHCRLCDTPLAADAKVCPRCGLSVLRMTRGAVEARPVDVLLAVMMAVAAGAVTFPLTYSAAMTLLRAGWAGTDFRGLFGVALWNSFVFGVPLVILARRWITRLRRGDFDRGWMWRDYWWFQLLAFSPIAGGMIALYSFTGRLDSLRWVLGF